MTHNFFITEYCFNSILLLVIVVNTLKLNFTIAMCIGETIV